MPGHCLLLHLDCNILPKVLLKHETLVIFFRQRSVWLTKLDKVYVKVLCKTPVLLEYREIYYNIRQKDGVNRLNSVQKASDLKEIKHGNKRNAE